MIEIKNLRKTYGKKVALKSFSYTFEDGIYGMLGANGAGKSTLMNLLTDNVKRDSGEILYDGKEILKMGGSYLEKVGYMPQQQGFYESFSARMFLVYMAELKGLRKKEAKKQIENLLEIVHLSHVADKKIGGFSGGMKQRVLLAQALLGGLKSSEEYDMPYLLSDFKKKEGYKRSIELSHEYNLYRQNYCGCVYSR